VTVPYAACIQCILYESDSTICCMYTVYPPEDEHLRLETCTGNLSFMNK